MAMQFQCFDPDLVKFEEHRPATPEEIARDEDHSEVWLPYGVGSLPFDS